MIMALQYVAMTILGLAILGCVGPKDCTETAFAERLERYTRVAALLEAAYAAFEDKQLDLCIEYCDEMLVVLPNYQVAVNLKDNVMKTKGKKAYYKIVAAQVESWKPLTSVKERVIPWPTDCHMKSRID